MRIVPLVTAGLVLGSLYLLVLERPMLREWAGAAEAQSSGEPIALAAATEDEAEPFHVVVRRFVERDLESGVLLYGRSALSRQVEVRAETTGVVASAPLARGSRIAAGDVLCQLDPGPRAAALAEAEAKLAEATLNAETALRLNEEGFAAQTRVATAQASLQAARAGVEAARAEMDRLTMTAPFAGVLERDTAETGSLLGAGGLCATVMQLDPMLMVGYAAESQIDRLRVGARAGAELSNGARVLGTVTFLGLTADPATRTFRVEVTVPNPDLSIRDGMSADILVEATATRGHLVPGSALTLDNEGTLGLRLVDADSRTFFAPITVLRDAPEGFWVSGLPAEADVIVVGQEYVTDGILVRVTRQEN